MGSDLSVEALAEALKKETGPGYPRCAFIIEIGNVLEKAEIERKRAEEILRELLDSENSEDKYLALCALLSAEKIEPETLSKLKDFKRNPQNANLLRLAERGRKLRKPSLKF